MADPASPVGLSPFDGDRDIPCVRAHLGSAVGLTLFGGLEGDRNIPCVRAPRWSPRGLTLFGGLDGDRDIPCVRALLGLPVGLTLFGGLDGDRDIPCVRVLLGSPVGLTLSARWRRRRAPGKLEIVRSTAADHQGAFVKPLMVPRAQGSHIANLVAATFALIPNMMQVQVPRRAASGHRAAVMVAREHLAPEARCHRRRHAGRLRRLERPDVLGIALRALDDLGTHLDLAAGAVLPAALAGLAYGDGDLVRRASVLDGACALERAPAQRLDERTIVEPAAVLVRERGLGLAKQRERIR